MTANVYIIQHVASRAFYQKTTRKGDDLFTPYKCGAHLFSKADAEQFARVLVDTTPGQNYLAVPYDFAPNRPDPRRFTDPFALCADSTREDYDNVERALRNRRSSGY